MDNNLLFVLTSTKSILPLIWSYKQFGINYLLTDITLISQQESLNKKKEQTIPNMFLLIVKVKLNFDRNYISKHLSTE